MPCYQMNTVTMEIKAKNADMIIEVLEEMNLRPVPNQWRTRIQTNIGEVDLNTGTFETQNYNSDIVNQFRVEYSKKALKVAAKKNKWVVKKRAGKNKFVAKKW